MFQNEYKIVGDYVIIYLNRRDNTPIECKIDLNDLDRIKEFGRTWCPSWYPDVESYYVKANIYLGTFDGTPKYNTIDMQRFIMNAKEKEYVDHIYHDSLDNRKSQLRVITNEQNTRNRKGRNSNNKSGYRNVSWSKSESKWLVQLQVNGKNKCLGKFEKEDVGKAGVFAKEMREKYYGEFAGKG